MVVVAGGEKLRLLCVPSHGSQQPRATNALTQDDGVQPGGGVPASVDGACSAAETRSTGLNVLIAIFRAFPLHGIDLH